MYIQSMMNVKPFIFNYTCSYSHQLQNLRSGNRYSIAVQTVTDVTIDPTAEDLINDYMFVLRVPGPVQNLNFGDISGAGAGLFVSWDRPDNSVEPESVLAIRRYLIVVYDENLVYVTNATTNQDLHHTFLFEDGIIQRNTLYNVSVRAGNDVGLGPPIFNIFTTQPLST